MKKPFSAVAFVNSYCLYIPWLCREPVSIYEDYQNIILTLKKQQIWLIHLKVKDVLYMLYYVTHRVLL